MMTTLIELLLCARTVLSMGPESSNHHNNPMKLVLLLLSFMGWGMSREKNDSIEITQLCE